MKLGFQLWMLLLGISREKLRMCLAIGAVALGLSSVMVLMALNVGAKQELQSILAQIGNNILTITPEKIQAISNRGGEWYMSETLKHKDLLSIAAHINGSGELVPISEESLVVKYAGEDIKTMVKGVTANFAYVRNFRLANGRLFSDAENEAKKRVAVLGHFIVDKLNDGFSMLNETVWIKGMPFEVIGQFQMKGMSNEGTNYDDLVIIPYKTAQTRLYSRQYLNRILVQTEEGADSYTVASDIRELLNDNHRIDNGEKQDFKVLSALTADRVRDTTNELLGGLAFFFTGITLFIGGAGILTVSYLNILDRKGEIGLRIALGAKRRNIINLFVFESLLLSILGGGVGLLFGIAAIYLLQYYTDWQLAFGLAVVVIPFILSMIIGLVFGVLPAYKASRMLPVDALRTD